MTDGLKVVELDEDCKPHVGSLTQRIEGVINDVLEENYITLAEVIGVLSIIRHKMIDDAIRKNKDGY